jgi:RNase P subunit RPR2
VFPSHYGRLQQYGEMRVFKVCVLNLDMSKLKKEEILKLVEKAKTSEDWRKIKKLAMANQIKLSILRRKFCQKCFYPLKGVTRINKGLKSVRCENCGKISRWMIKREGMVDIG